MTTIKFHDLSKPSLLYGHNILKDSFAGSVGTKNVNGYELIKISESEEATLPKSNFDKKENVRFFRLSTDRMRDMDIQPYVKINIDRGLVYFLTERSSHGEIDEAEFETRGVKAVWLHLDKSYQS